MNTAKNYTNINFVWRCNTFNDLSHRVCVPNKTEYLNIHVFNMITEKNESKIVTKICNGSCEWICNFDRRKYKLNQKWIMINVDAGVKSIIYVKKLYLESCCM